MHISKINLVNYINTQKTIKPRKNNLEKPQDNGLNFLGSQTKPLTVDDYLNAKQELPKTIARAQEKSVSFKVDLDELDLEKINGLQKGIRVFEGLTMAEIDFALKRPILLINRGCPNSCLHCGYMATPYSNKTFDKASFEDFNNLIEGICELKSRLGPKVTLCPKMELFLDSDCIAIEMTDKEGNVYDYIDCIEILNKKDFVPPLFDTSGWDPNCEKSQQRAEKFVQYIINPKNSGKIRELNVSITPYHILFAQAMNLKSNFHFIKAKEREEKYTDRMANTLFTFTPILDAKVAFNILSRTDDGIKLKSKGNNETLKKLNKKILKALEKKYNADLVGEKRYIKTKDDIKKYLDRYSSIIQKSKYEGWLESWGRAEYLYKNTSDTKEKRQEETLKKIKSREINTARRIINPNGTVLLLDRDISVLTDLQFNFENKDKPVKKFAHQITDCVYQSNKSD